MNNVGYEGTVTLGGLKRKTLSELNEWMKLGILWSKGQERLNCRSE